MKNKNITTDRFYSKKGIILIICAALVFTATGIVGMYMLGIVKMPSFMSAFFNKSDAPTASHIAMNIHEEDKNKTFYEALPREEYAIALADISIPEEYYQRYTITLYSGETVRSTDYTVIYKRGDWWVQTKENDVILSTVVCKDKKVKLSDNSDNTSVTDVSGEIDCFEYFGYTSLAKLADMIRALAKGETVIYPGGVADFSLSYTKTRGTGENIFNFSLTRGDGFKEEYTFAFESATILSAVKYSPSGEKIYQMEMKDSRNDIEGIFVNSLFVIE